jgi:hypothetical protein
MMLGFILQPNLQISRSWSGSTPVGWVERRNPTIPALTERSIKSIGNLYTIPIIKILNIQSIFDIGAVWFRSSTQLQISQLASQL